MNEYINFTEYFLEALGIFDFGVKWNGAVKMFLVVISLGTFYITGVIDLINTKNDFSRSAETLSMLLVGFTGFVKYYTLIYNREKMKNFRDVVKFRRISGQELNSEHRSIIYNYDQVGLSFCKTYGWILFLVCQGMLLQTLPGILLGHGLQLPFSAVYPFSLSSTPMFTVAYIHQIISTYIYFMIYLTFDTWFIFLIHHACGEYCLLQNLLENIAAADQQPFQIRERIERCVRLHQNIYKFSDELEDVYNIPNLMKFLVSSMAVCISGYEAVITGFENPQMLVKHFSSASGQIVQSLIYNWCGQLMEEKSLGVSHAISRSTLYKLGVVHQRDLSFMMLRAQKPAYITAGKFANLSLLNFTNFMKTTMSYFTMLTSVHEN